MYKAPIDLNETLKTTLAEYVEANAQFDTNNLRVAREISIARMALDEGTKIYLSSIAMLKTFVEQLFSSMDAGKVDLQKLDLALNQLNKIEEKSARVVANADKCASIAKKGAEIETLLTAKLDAAQVYSIITQLPSLLHTLHTSLLSQTLTAYFLNHNLSIVNGRPLNVEEVAIELSREASAVVCNQFNEELERNVNLLTYKQQQQSPNSDAQPRAGSSVIEEQVVKMLNSVPFSPIAVDPNAPEAKLREL